MKLKELQQDNYVVLPVYRGVHPPETMIHFPPCFRFPPIFEKISDSVENFPNFTFSRTIFPFSSAKISHDLFLVIDHKFRISPLFFHASVHFPSVSRKLLFPPTFTNFPPVFEKVTCFLHAFCVFRFPPTLIMMHSCITQCTYWTPLAVYRIKSKNYLNLLSWREHRHIEQT